MESNEAFLLNHTISNCIRIAATTFHTADPSWVVECIFIKLIINLNDCVVILDRNGSRIDFSDELPTGVDVTDRIRRVRNAACHITSRHREFDDYRNSLHFGVVVGRSGLISGAADALENPYDDDVAFFYGSLRLLFKRHIRRAVEEAVPRAKALCERNGHQWWASQ